MYTPGSGCSQTRGGGRRASGFVNILPRRALVNGHVCVRFWWEIDEYRREFRWFGLLLKVIDTVTLSIIKFSILILAQIVENRESRQTGQIAGARLPAVLYEDLFSS